MKRRLITALLAIAPFSLLATQLHAQSYVIRGNIPFSFQVRNASFPAGTYVFRKEAQDDYEIMRNVQTRESIALRIGPHVLTGKGNPRLVFHRYGKDYFLSQVWTANGTGGDLPLTKREKEVRESWPKSEVASVTLDLATLNLVSKR
jgi:hypothetical protein